MRQQEGYLRNSYCRFICSSSILRRLSIVWTWSVPDVRGAFLVILLIAIIWIEMSYGTPRLNLTGIWPSERKRSPPWYQGVQFTITFYLKLLNYTDVISLFSRRVMDLTQMVQDFETERSGNDSTLSKFYRDCKANISMLREDCIYSKGNHLKN